MSKWKVLIAHAKGEEALAEKLAEPLRQAGYDVAHRGTVFVGESIVEDAAKTLNSGGPVVLCGTVQAVGTKWARRVINAASERQNVRVFALQIDEEADLESLMLESVAADYWRDPTKAVQDLIAALGKYYPPHDTASEAPLGYDAELKYRKLLLDSCDIIDLANLPESERHLATRRLELRRLYVPLRVKLELRAEAELSDTALEELERKRQLRRTALQQDKDESLRYSIGERLAKNQRLVILGDPGAGKSTIIRWLATAYLLRLKHDPDWNALPDIATLPEQDFLPIIIRCRDLDLSSTDGSLDDMLWRTLTKAEFSEHETKALRTLLREQLQQSRALLLIDGLDEIADLSLRVRFCRQLEQIQRAFPDAPIIATSRIVGYREMRHRIGSGFEHVTIADLSPREKDEFARRWSALTEPLGRQEAVAQELIHSIHSMDRIERLTGNPMLLTTLALVKRKVGKLPRRRVDLYSEAVQVLLNWRSEVDEPIDAAEAIPQLEYIAYAMCERGAQQLRKDEVLELLHLMRQEYPQIHPARAHTPEEFLPLLERRTGILLESGHIRHLGVLVPIFEFRHLTLQEYLAARALVDGRFPGRNRSRRLAENIAPLAKYQSTQSTDTNPEESTGNWREVLRLCASCCSDDDTEDVFRAIFESTRQENPKATARPRAILAALCLADEPNVSDSIAKAVLKRLLTVVHPHNDFLSTSGLTSAIKELSSSRWANDLRLLLLEHFYKAKARPEKETFGYLYGIFAEASIPESTIQLQQWLDEKGVAITSTDELTAIEAALSLGQLRTWRFDLTFAPTKQLLTMLFMSPAAVYAGTLALGRLAFGELNKHGWVPTTKEIETIITFLSKATSDFETVSRLIKILGSFFNPKAYKLLTSKLVDPVASVRAASATALGNLGDIDACPLLINSLDDVPEVSSAAAEALGKLGASQAIEPLLRLLDSTNILQKSAAIEALGLLRATHSVEAIIKIAQTPGGPPHTALEALGRIGDPLSFHTLIENLDSRYDFLAIRALGELGDDRALQPLATKLKDHNSSNGPAIVEALGRLGDTRAVPILIDALQHPFNAVRVAAASSLGLLQDQRAVEPLSALLLSERDPSACFAAAEVLALLGEDCPISIPFDELNALVARLNSRLPRKVGILILGKLRDKRATQQLIAKLQDPDPYTSLAAALALAELGNPLAIEPLIHRLRDPDYNIKQVTAEALGKFRADAIQPLLKELLTTETKSQPYALYALMRSTNPTDRTLLSKRLDGAWPPLSIQDVIDEGFIRHASKRLGLTEGEIQRRYESLAQLIPLKLEWHFSSCPTPS